MTVAIVGSLHAAAAAQPAQDAPATLAEEPRSSLSRGPARWVPVDWDSLPGWQEDRLLEAFPALLASCQRPAPGWSQLCARALLDPPADEASLRTWLQRWLLPWRIESSDGRPEGLATGYFEPLLQASRQASAAFPVALHRPPADLEQRRPHYSRQEFDTVPAAQASLSGREIAWLADPLDLLLLQIQGSGRLLLQDTAGASTLVRVAYAGHNGHPYGSVGRWLIDRGELRPQAASWPAIRAWAVQNPHRVQEMMWANPRVVFFREEPLPDPEQGPRGAQGVPLTPLRSVAVDPGSVPYGTPLWISTTDPLGGQQLRRLMLAQDTGSAITGAVRIDVFWGWGETALERAGRMRQPLNKWALWPRGVAPPASP